MGCQLPDFPVDALPGRIKYFIENAAETLNCPADFIGVFVLTVVSSAIGTARAIRLKEGWVESPVLYSAVVAPPASKKSPAFNLALTPIRQKQMELKAAHAKELEEFELEMEQWEFSNKANKKPKKPVFSRNFVNDFTVEALARILLYNQKGLLLGLDELAAWIKSMDQYLKGKGSDREKWLSLWTCSEILIDRASIEEPIVLSRPFVSVTSGIQPDRLKLLTGNHHDGFVERILFSFPEPIPDKWVEHRLSDTILQAYCQLYDDLYSLQPEIEAAVIKPKILDLSALAKEGVILFYNNNVSDINTEPNPILKAAFKKIEAYTARFALILQLCEDPESLRVEEGSIKRAAVLAEYFKSHARKVYAHIEGVLINDKILRAVEALKSHGGPMSLRECYTKKVANCKNAGEARQLFRELTRKGYGKMVEIKNSGGGRPTVQFRLNGW